MDSRHQEICLTTLVIGANYRKHALVLARVIQSLASDIPFVILTDSPEIFPKSTTTIPIKHRVRSVGIYHDKLDCVAESFRLGFDTCFFLDADCRLFQNATLSRNWKPGITARSCYDLDKHILKRNRSGSGLYEFIESVARGYDIQVNQCKFIYEWIFVVRKNGREERFLEVWKEIRNILEMNRIFIGEGLAIGMAANIAGCEVHHFDTGYPEEAFRHRIVDVYKEEFIPDAYPMLTRKKSTISIVSEIVSEKRSNSKISFTEGSKRSII